MIVTKTIKILDFGVLIFSVLGSLLFANKMWEGYYVLLIANCMSIYISKAINFKSSLIRNLIFFVINIVGIYNTMWR